MLTTVGGIEPCLRVIGAPNPDGSAHRPTALLLDDRLGQDPQRDFVLGHNHVHLVLVLYEDAPVRDLRIEDHATKPPRAKTRTPVRRNSPDRCCNHHSMAPRARSIATRPVRAVVIPRIKMTYPKNSGHVIRIQARTGDPPGSESSCAAPVRRWCIARSGPQHPADSSAGHSARIAG